MPEPKPKKVETLLVELTELKDKMANAKEILKNYKVRSERLTQLKRAKKDLNEQVEEEKRNIEDEFLEDKDYEAASNDELTLKNQLREKNSEIRESLAQFNRDQDLSTYDYNVKGEPIKLQVQRVVKVFINGKEEK
ncbi:hypothetical protein KAR91_52305 [Candidatus Pacearchaeota archaeon]|nr:hypothetical protein [Candidatus Pacearchaeota archaeon]